MKKIIWLGITAICVLTLATAAYAGTDQVLSSSITATVGTIFSMEWEDNADNVSYPGGGPLSYTDIDPTQSQVYADNHTTGTGGKPDIALICKSNETPAWGIKTATSGDLSGKLLYYMAQPTVWNGSSAVATTGTLANPTPGAGDPWPVFPENSVIYTSGNDNINTPYGTYCGLDIAINPTGLASGSSANGQVTFTMTQNL